MRGVVCEACLAGDGKLPSAAAADACCFCCWACGCMPELLLPLLMLLLTHIPCPCPAVQVRRLPSSSSLSSLKVGRVHAGPEWMLASASPRDMAGMCWRIARELFSPMPLAYIRCTPPHSCMHACVTLQHAAGGFLLSRTAWTTAPASGPTCLSGWTACCCCGTSCDCMHSLQGAPRPGSTPEPPLPAVLCAGHGPSCRACMADPCP